MNDYAKITKVSKIAVVSVFIDGKYIGDANQIITNETGSYYGQDGEYLQDNGEYITPGGYFVTVER